MVGDNRVDTKALLARIDIADTVGRYVKLKKSGREYTACCPFHQEKTPSFYVVPDKQFAVCFGCGFCDDAIGFLQEYLQIPFREAVAMLDINALPEPVTRITPRERIETVPDWTPITPVPASAPDMDPGDLWNAKRGEPSHLNPTETYEYRDATGQLLGYVLRVEFDGRKITPTITYCVHRGTGETRWCIAPFSTPRPVYGLDDLAARPKARVLIVEGERCRDTAQLIFPNMVALAWVGGGNGIRHVDWTPVFGRDVVLWPDHDESGREAMQGIGEILSPAGGTVRVVDTRHDDLAKGWDVADAVRGGQTRDEIIAWVKQRIVDWPLPAIASPDTSPEETPAPGTPEPAKEPEAGSCATGDEGQPTAEPATPQPEAPRPRPRGKPDLRVATIDGSAVRKPAPKPRAAPSEQVAQHLEARNLGLSMTAQGTAHCNEHNVIQVLTKHPDFAGKVWHDDFHRITFTSIYGDPEPWSERLTLRMLSLLQGAYGMPKLQMRHVENAVRTVGYGQRRHCVREWLESLTWDGEPRLDTFMCDAFGARQNPYTSAVGRCWLVAMVARAMWPGCQADNMVILEGGEGARKTSALHALANKWFSECHAEMVGKQFQEQLQGAWLLEIAEMNAIASARQVEGVKALITCRNDRFRPVWGRQVEDHPRQTILCGTTNRNDWNVSETGARRFWPIACGIVDLEYIEQQRDQLFAEAVQRFKRYPADAKFWREREANGAAWWDVPIDEAKAEQSAREDSDAIEDVIIPWLIRRDIERINVNEIMEQCFEMNPKDRDIPFQKRIAKVLRRVGWVSVTKHNPAIGRAQKMWLRPAGWGPPKPVQAQFAPSAGANDWMGDDDR